MCEAHGDNNHALVDHKEVSNRTSGLACQRCLLAECWEADLPPSVVACRTRSTLPS